ncbi:NAD(P)/FAD-dependent oxidoreductase [Gloeothece verrucosa]|uniref:FAD dependent oxidoreductase n=1 Tax=Gloeothece verrucosa (strain PCC 7822) TaxID=497965 RepID=E0UAQ1_GLOV7|nr:NAD(P)/FAD-dependent oxidoreductase [Gloeothece verrucosa]ADN13903.1 FAD dependent oxidoreductase [Gloeothece verrucosa PCC 7822]
MNYEIAIIGGGPAGASLATYLARAGKSVAIFEKSDFPRFHIGESLLPATMPILQDLGVYERMRSTFLNKPGGCWYYDDTPVMSDFAKCRETASFKDFRHAFMVERGEFDRILLDNARDHGVRVFQHHLVREAIWEGERMTGLQVKDLQTMEGKSIRTEMVFDCSGYRSVIASQRNLRKPNRLKKMAIFAHYRAEALEERLKQGWFVGQMFYDGWLWLIPIDKDRISIGVVTTLDNYKKASISPEQFLDHYIRTLSLTRKGLGKNIERVSDIYLYGNLGYSSERIFGDRWALVGDAAVFIDPCYSSGVHLAMDSAREIARVYLEHGYDARSLQNALSKYEKRLRQHEELVLMLVDSFYMASRNKFLRFLVKNLSKISSLNQKFVHFTGGDLADDPGYIKMTYYTHLAISALANVFQRQPSAAPEKGKSAVLIK